MRFMAAPNATRKRVGGPRQQIIYIVRYLIALKNWRVSVTTSRSLIMAIDNVLYRANATATGGREGRAVSSDSALDVKLTTPKELGGNGLAGTNPE